MKAFSIFAGLLLVPASLWAQARPAVKKTTPTTRTTVAAPKAAAAPASAVAAADPAAETTAPPAPIPLAPVTPPADPNALKIKADVNPVSHLLTVRCDAPGPTRIEINDQDGRPILTKNTLIGTTPVSLNVSTLPAGPYVVRCTAGDKKGTRLVQIN